MTKAYIIIEYEVGSYGKESIISVHSKLKDAEKILDFYRITNTNNSTDFDLITRPFDPKILKM